VLEPSLAFLKDLRLNWFAVIAPQGVHILNPWRKKSAACVAGIGTPLCALLPVRTIRTKFGRWSGCCV